jgi:type I restriction-modification system DNA methylase subunit
MAPKKSELYSFLWQSCDELRDSMDASQYKDYVLVPLFLKYISVTYAGKKYAPIRTPFGAGFPEQTTIAAVLSDMDTALTALEQRRDKTRALKKGMMQNSSPEGRGWYE